MQAYEAATFISQLCSQSCQELFAVYGCQISECEAQDLEDAPIAVIDAGSDEIELMTVMQIPLSVLALTYPSTSEGELVEVTKLEDWIAELANQFIGRFKAKLLDCGQRVQIGLPASYFGNEVEEFLEDTAENFTFNYDVDGEPMSCSLSISILSSEIEIEETGGEDADSAAGEGELEMF